MYSRVMFIGSKELGYSALKKMYDLCPENLIACITIDDKEDTRSHVDFFESFCRENRIPIHILSDHFDLTKYVENYYPDICFVLGWYYIIDRNVLNMVKGGFIGVHCSALPRYRGFAPIVWQMINGEHEIGISLFSLVERMDEGDIWASDVVKVEDNDYVSDVLNKVNTKILLMIEKNYKKIIAHNIIPRKQEIKGVSYCAKRISEDGCIDWKKDSRYIYNFIRAQSYPYPGAFTFFQGAKVIIWCADIFEDCVFGTPGQVAMIAENGVVISCGNNEGIIVKEIEYNGKKTDPKNIFSSLDIRLNI